MTPVLGVQGPAQSRGTLQSVALLFRADQPSEHATEVLDGVYLSTNRDLLRALLGRDKPMEGLRVFIGYSGWVGGQLEREIARGDWTLAPADARAIFDAKSPHPGSQRRHPGMLRSAAMERGQSGLGFDVGVEKFR